MRHSHARIELALLPLVLGACMTSQRDATAERMELAGTVTYLPRIALPPDAVVHVRLEDASNADTAARVVADTTVQTTGRQVPIPFRLAYDRARIDTSHQYVVHAEIHGGDGERLWTTDSKYPVLTAGAPVDSIEVRVTQVEPDSAMSGTAVGALRGATWQLVHIETPAGTTTPKSDERYTIVFGTDGRYNGQADCNRYGGEYTNATGDKLELTRGLSTLAACPPGSSSDDFFRVFNSVDTFAITGDQLRLTTPDRGILLFQRAASDDASGARE